MAPVIESTSSVTRVFWDLEDFPVPHGGNINSFPMKIKKSLHIEGYWGDISFMIYSGKKSEKSQNHLRAIDFLLSQEADEKVLRLNSMLLDMVSWAYRNPPSGFIKKRVNFMVIAKDIPKEEVETEFAATLGELEKRGYNIFLVVPDESTLSQAPFPDADLVWHWKKLFDGDEASFPLDSDYDYDCEEESSHGVKRPKISDDGCENQRVV